MRTRLIPLALGTLLAAAPWAQAGGDITCWFPPAWKDQAPQAKVIADALGQRSGEAVKPRIAAGYPDILDAFSAGEPCLVYVGSFVQAIIQARGTGVPLAQAVDGNEQYASWMVHPRGQDPQAILRGSPADVAYAVGASSGESGAKAATGGKAALGVASHQAAAAAVKAGKAKAAFVKNTWWTKNRDKFPELDAWQVPGVSEAKNPDNVLTASKGVPEATREKLRQAALAAKDAFGAREMAAFDGSRLGFSLGLMEKGRIDPKTYAW